MTTAGHGAPRRRRRDDVHAAADTISLLPRRSSRFRAVTPHAHAADRRRHDVVAIPRIAAIAPPDFSQAAAALQAMPGALPSSYRQCRVPFPARPSSA